MEITNFTISKMTKLFTSLLMVVCMFSYVNEVSAQGSTCATAVPVGLGTHTAAAFVGAGASNTCHTGATDAGWYTFTAPATPCPVSYTITSGNDPASSDTRLAVYTAASACGALTCLANDDDGGPGFTSTVTQTLTPGATYIIEWDDRWFSGGNGFQWEIQGGVSPTPVLALGADGCTVTSTWTSNCGGPVDLELCFDGVCMTVPGVTSPYVFDACALGYAPGTMITASTLEPGFAPGGVSNTVTIPFPPYDCANGTQTQAFLENFDAGGAMTGFACGWNIDSNGTGSGGTGPLTGSAPSAPNYLYAETSCTATGLAIEVASNVAIPMCAAQSELNYMWHFAGFPGSNIVESQVSYDGGATWVTAAVHTSGDTPSQASPFTMQSVSLGAGPATVSVRFIVTQDTRFEDFAVDNVAINYCVECDPAIAAATAAAPMITNLDCLNPTGTITAPAATGCPAGSTYQYSTDLMTWTTTPPAYQTTAITVYTRCNCDCDNTVSSAVTSVMTAPILPGPTVATCNPTFTVALDASGNGTITTADIDNGSIGSCGAPTLSLSQTMISCADYPATTVTLTATDPILGSTSTCTSIVTVPVAPPVAICNDLTVNLGPAGVAAIGLLSLDGGASTATCGAPIRILSQNRFDCNNVGLNEVSLTVTDPITNQAASCTSTVTIFGNQTCIDNGSVFINNSGPSITDPCECDGVGGFNEQVVVRDPNPMSQWDIKTVTGLTDAPGPNSNPIVAGFTPLNNIGLTGDGTRTMYEVTGNHLDGEGYEIIVTSPWYPGVEIGVSNTCFYPLAQFNFNLDTVLCANTGDIPLDGIGLSQKDGVTEVDGTKSFKVNGVAIAGNTVNPLDLGPGTHVIEFCFDAGQALGLKKSFDPATGLFVVDGAPTAATVEEAQDDPGCEVCVSDEIFVFETPSDLKCNDQIQASLDGDCEALIGPDDILEGSYDCFDDYTVALSFNGRPLANPLTANLTGQVIRAEVTHLPSGNKCWGDILLEDKLGPEFVCSVSGRDKLGNPLFVGDGTPGNPVIVDCAFDLSLIPDPVSVDNCIMVNSFLQNETNSGALCERSVVTRTYGAQDMHGNVGDNCTITIVVNTIGTNDIVFPSDITWSCEQYAAFNNITDAAPLHPFVPADPTTLDPNWDDTRENCAPRAEDDRDDCKLNLAGSYVACPTGPHTPADADSPVLDPTLVDGLEDADILELTGAGAPNVFGLDGNGCKFITTHSDQRLEACEGADMDKTFKIIRTWTVLNWCTGETVSRMQVIKVLDVTEPVFDMTNWNDVFVVNEELNDGCRFSGLIGLPDVTDNCSGVAEISLEIFEFGSANTPNISGQFIAAGIPVFDGGDLVGFRVPSPFLAAGDRYRFIFSALDGCGNKAEVRVSTWIQDAVTPTAVCREITQVSLATGPNGLAPVLADFFDEGSYDNCGPVFFKVRKMELGTCDNANIDKDEELNHTRGGNCDIDDPEEWFDDDVIFCCEEVGTSVNVILRVYDRNPSCPHTSAVPTLQTPTGLHFDPRCSSNCELLGNAPEGTTYEGLNNGHYTDCMIEVLVEDKTRPACVAPADVWVTCSEVPGNIDWEAHDAVNAHFGGPTVFDNCGATVDVDDVEVELDLCGVGRVIRTFQAVDNDDNRHVGACRQVIMITPITDYCVTLPADFEGECDNANSPNELEWTETGCDLLAVSKEVLPLLAGGNDGECKKEIIKWSVINWCEYDGISLPIELPRADWPANMLGMNRELCSNGLVLAHTGTRPVSYTSTGYFTYDQHVKIFDNTAPVVTFDGDLKFAGGDLDQDPCTGQVDIDPTVTEECTDKITVTWAVSAFSSTYTSADFTGTGALSQRFPLGTHTVRFSVSDDCGNTSFLDLTIDIVDAKAPTPVCYNGLSVELMPSGMVEVWASDFDASSFDYCQDIKLLINRIEDENGDGFITEDDHRSVDDIDDFEDVVIFTCDDLAARFINVQLWVGEVPGDDCNDWDYCTTFIEVQDNMGNCGSTSRTATVNGAISTENGDGVKDVNVTVSGDITNNFMTDLTGSYSFTANEQSDVSVTPMKVDDVRNGVSTFDLALISKHVLNVQPLNSPYKLIAADANNSGSVSTLDLVAIRKVILFVSNEFPNNTSWRFVDKGHIFTNPQSPWADNFQEVKNFNNIVGVNTADFVGIKVGDVSGDVDANGLGSIDDRNFNGTFNLNTENVVFNAGDEVRVAIDADLASIDGYQATMNFNTKVLELIDIESAELTKENFGTTMTAEGVVTMSWNGQADNDEAFTLVFTAKANGSLDNELAISSLYTAAEAYTGTEVMNVDLTFGGSASDVEFSLHQNTPNPFTAETVIGFELPTADAATLTISDLSGKVLRVIRGNYEAGYNSINVEMTNNLPVGVLIYELETSTDKATRKMTVVK